MSADKRIGHALARHRVALGISQEDLAVLSTERGSTMWQGTVGKIERGLRPLRLSEAVVFADIFRVTLDDLVDRGEAPEGGGNFLRALEVQRLIRDLEARRRELLGRG